MKTPLLLSEPSLKAIERLAMASSQILVALDYDGTLATPPDEGGEAALPKPTRELLRRLAGRPNISLAVLSGRTLDDLKKRVGVREVTLAALHGLEMLVGGEVEQHDDLVRAESIIEGAKEELRATFAAAGDVRIEDRRVSIVIHHGRLTKKAADALAESAQEALRNERVRILREKRSIEIFPDIASDSSLSVRRFMEHHRKLGSLPLLICASDDAADVPALRIARDFAGVAIAVGRESLKGGNYLVESPADLLQFLELLDGWHAAKALAV